MQDVQQQEIGAENPTEKIESSNYILFSQPSDRENKHREKVFSCARSPICLVTDCQLCRLV